MERARLKALLEDFSGKEKDLLKLIEDWKFTTPKSDPRSITETQIAEAVKNENDLQKLIQAYLHVATGSYPERIIEPRIAKIVEGENDLQNLVRAWKRTIQVCNPRRRIEARIEEVIKEVTLENVPAWFEEQLKNPSFPQWVLDEILRRAEELLDEHKGS